MESTTADRKGRGYKTLLVVGALAAMAVFLATFLMSAPAVTAVAAAAGTGKHIAWAMVVAVDGLMITGTVVYVSRKLRGGSVWYPIGVLLAGIALSIVCNALHSLTAHGKTLDLKGWAPYVSAIPAVSMALSFHLIADMIKDWLTPSGVVRETVEAPAETMRETATVLSQTAAETPSQTLAAPSQTAIAAPSQTVGETPHTPSETPAETPSETRPRRRRTPAETAPETSAKTVKAPPLREQLRPLLAADPTLAAPELAEKLDRENSGGLRQTRTRVLVELAAEGVIEMPAELRPRAVGE